MMQAEAQALETAGYHGMAGGGLSPYVPAF